MFKFTEVRDITRLCVFKYTTGKVMLSKSAISWEGPPG